MSVNRTSSIRSQLIGWLMIPITSLCLVSAIATYFIAIRITTQAYDAALIESARELANRVTIAVGQVSLDLPPAALAVFKEDNIDKFYYAALTTDGRLIAGDRDILQSIRRGPQKLPRCQSGRIDGKPVRIAYLDRAVQGNPNLRVAIYVAETVLKRQALTNQILVAVVVPQLFLIGLASLAVWIGVARGLAPLKVVRAAIASRSQWDLRPLEEVGAPVEIRPLVDAIDDLLRRLNDDIEAQRRFVANAAHQLRTPLAGLKTQTELAIRQKDIAELERILKQIHRGVDNVTRLVNQLLSLARLEPTGVQSQEHAQIDLNLVVKEATKEMVPYALNKDIDLGFEGSHQSACIIADTWSIRELVTNLIDNAVRYTQSGGKVTVKIQSEGREGIRLLVEDDGPGIPENERERVFERFYRVLGNNVGGSGLGLSIVKEIAQAHKAQVTVSTGCGGTGTVVSVLFGDAMLPERGIAAKAVLANAAKIANPAGSIR